MSINYNTGINNQTNLSQGDLIQQLPVDRIQPSNSEIHLVNTLFKEHKNTLDVIADESKESVLIALLVVLVSLVQITEFINKILPITVNSPYILVIVKGLIAGVLFWIIKHFYLSRKQ